MKLISFQSYVRSARLLLQLGKLDSAAVMAERALERLTEKEPKRRADINLLGQKISEARENKRKAVSSRRYHFGKLPIEIAVTIFSLALADDHPKAVVLAQVCKPWRHTILNTNSFWSVLSLSRRNPARKASLWKVRCQSRPEALHVREAHENVLRALDRLSDVSLHRLRTLTLRELFLGEFLLHLPSFTPNVLCNLHTIVIQDVLDDQSWLWGHPDMQVRNLTIERCSAVVWSDLAKHCHLLQTFSFEGIIDQNSLPDLLKLLESNEGLTTLVLVVSPGEINRPRARPSPDEEDRVQPLILMPHLSHLNLRSDVLSPSALITRLSLPALRALHLARCPEALDELLQHLIHTGVPRRLTELRIERAFASSDIVLRFLQDAEDLQVLALSNLGSNQVNSVVKKLAAPLPSNLGGSSEPPDCISSFICPALTHLDFSCSPDLQSGPVVQLIKNRLSPSETPVPPSLSVAPIESLNLDSCTSISADIIPWLRASIANFSCIYLTKKQAKWKR